MQNQISSERFEAIVDAYGADAQRWPQAERAAALLFMQQNPETARRVMAEARTLDGWLSAAEEVEPSAALQWGVLAHMMPADVTAKVVPVPSTVRPRRRWVAGGIGLAAACAAGIIFGVNVGLATTSEARAEAVLASASLTEVDNW